MTQWDGPGTPPRPRAAGAGSAATRVEATSSSAGAPLRPGGNSQLTPTTNTHTHNRNSSTHTSRREAFMFRTHIKKHELGLLFRRGDFVRVVEPGDWILPGIWLGIDRLEIVNVLEPRFRHPLL